MTNFNYTIGNLYTVNKAVMQRASREHRIATGEYEVVSVPAGTVMRCDLVDATGHAFQMNDDGSYTWFGMPSCLEFGDVTTL